jgi:hypothetical protein
MREATAPAGPEAIMGKVAPSDMDGAGRGRCAARGARGERRRAPFGPRCERMGVRSAACEVVGPQTMARIAVPAEMSAVGDVKTVTAEVQSTKTGAAEPHPAEVHSPEMHPTKMHAPEPAEMHSASTEVHSASTEVAASETSKPSRLRIRCDGDGHYRRNQECPDLRFSM